MTLNSPLTCQNSNVPIWKMTTRVSASHRDALWTIIQYLNPFPSVFYFMLLHFPIFSSLQYNGAFLSSGILGPPSTSVTYYLSVHLFKWFLRAPLLGRWINSLHGVSPNDDKSSQTKIMLSEFQIPRLPFSFHFHPIDILKRKLPGWSVLKESDGACCRHSWFLSRKLH